MGRTVSDHIACANFVYEAKKVQNVKERMDERWRKGSVHSFSRMVVRSSSFMWRVVHNVQKDEEKKREKRIVVRRYEYDLIGRLLESHFPFLHPKLALLLVPSAFHWRKCCGEILVGFLQDGIGFPYKMTSYPSQRWIGILQYFALPYNFPVGYRPSHALSCTSSDRAASHTTNKSTTVFNLPVSTTQGLEAKVESPGRMEALVDSSKYLGWQSGGFKSDDDDDVRMTYCDIVIVIQLHGNPPLFRQWIERTTQCN